MRIISRILALTIALLCALAANAQGRYVVSGTAMNARSDQPVEFATAALLRADSTAVTSTMTEEDGTFALRTASPGRYIVKLSFVGFTPFFQNVELTEQADSVGLGRLRMESAERVLGTATVTAVAARVEQKEDTTVFNASAYRTPEGSTLEALVKQLPGVEVSDDGTIKWNGKTVSSFLVNGKDFFKGDTKVAMKNLPVEMVSKIKAYDKASDYTEQTGIDDGEESTVLDINTKRELNQSWVANIDLGIGTRNRYTEKAFVNRFDDRSRITAYASANNVNDAGFGGPRGMGGNSGLTASKQAGFDFSWENGRDKKEAGRVELGGNVQYSHKGTDVVSTSSSEQFLASTSSFSNSESYSGSSQTGFDAQLRAQWRPDTLTTIMFRPQFTYSKSRGLGSSLSATFNDDPADIDDMYSPLDSIFQTASINADLASILVNSHSSKSKSSSRSTGVSGSLNVTRVLNRAGRNVSLMARGGYTEGKSESFSISDIRYYTGSGSTRFTNQYTNRPSKNWNYSLRLSYVEPLGNNWFAEARYEYAHKYQDSNRSRYNVDSLRYGQWASDLDGVFDYTAIGALPTSFTTAYGDVVTRDDLLNSVRDLYNSQYATYKYDDHTANIGVRYNTQAIRFSAGLGLNPEHTKMAYERPGQNIDTVITRNVVNFAPNARLRLRFSKTSQLEFNYRGSSSQPSMTDLLAVVDNSNPLSISMGNPGLKPSWTNTLRAFYRGYNATRQQGMGFGLFFNQTRNSISNRSVYDETTGTTYSRPENISGNWDTNGFFMFNSPLDHSKLLTVTTRSNVSYKNAVGYVSSFASDASSAISAIDGSYDSYSAIFDAAGNSKNKTRTLSLGEDLALNFRQSFYDFGLTGKVTYQHARATLQENANLDTWQFSYGATANAYTNFGLSFSTDIRMSSRRGYSLASMNTNELLWNAQISQSFLKKKAATISVQFYDILHKQSNVSRTLSATMRSDSWTNAINSYVMVHFIYKFSAFNGSKKQDNDGDPNRPMDGPEGRPGNGERPSGPPPSGGGGPGGGGFGGPGGGGFGGGR